MFNYRQFQKTSLAQMSPNLTCSLPTRFPNFYNISDSFKLAPSPGRGKPTVQSPEKEEIAGTEDEAEDESGFLPPPLNVVFHNCLDCPDLTGLSEIKRGH